MTQRLSGIRPAPRWQLPCRLMPRRPRLRLVPQLLSGLLLLGTQLGAIPTAEALNHALEFDADAYVRMVDTLDAPEEDVFSTGDYTVELWVRLDPAGAGSQQLLIKELDAGENGRASVHFSLSIEGRRVEMRYATDANGDGDVQDPGEIVAARDPDALPDGTWHHVAGVYRATPPSLRLYVNGAEQARREEAGLTPARRLRTQQVTLGAHFTRNNSINPVSPFRGLLDEVRIWNVARSEEEIRTNQNRPFGTPDNPVPANLVTYWKCDEGRPVNPGAGETRPDVVDDSGRDHHGKLGSLAGRAEAVDPTWTGGAPALGDVPDIRVTDPATGPYWYPGRANSVIAWTSEHVETLRLDYCVDEAGCAAPEAPDGFRPIAENLAASSGRFTWPPAAIPTDVASDHVRIRAMSQISQSPVPVHGLSEPLKLWPRLEVNGALGIEQDAEGPFLRLPPGTDGDEYPPLNLTPAESSRYSLTVTGGRADPANRAHFAYSWALLQDRLDGNLRTPAGLELTATDPADRTRTDPDQRRVFFRTPVGVVLAFTGEHVLTLRVDDFRWDATNVQSLDFRAKVQVLRSQLRIYRPPEGELPVVAEAGLPYPPPGRVMEFEARGGTRPYTWESVGPLPASLSLQPVGADRLSARLTGTPEASLAGTTRALTARLRDSAVPQGEVTRNYTLRILRPVRITTESLPLGEVGVPYTAVIRAADGQGPYSWTLATSPPPGLALNTNVTGDDAVVHLEGTPALEAAGTQTVTVNVVDAAGYPTSRQFTFETLPPPFADVTLARGQPGYLGTASLPQQPTGIAWAQANGDELLDVAVTADRDSGGTGAGVRFLRQLPDHTFDMWDASSFGATSYQSPAWGDLENDGDPDLLIAVRDTDGNPLNDGSRVYVNQGGARPTFQNAPESSGLADFGPLEYGLWADFNRDGWLDLYVVPEHDEFTPVGDRQLLRNSGPGDTTPFLFALQARSLLAGRATSGGGAWGDFDNDGFLDLNIADQPVTEEGQNPCCGQLYHNEGTNADGTHRDFTGTIGLGAGWLVTWADSDNDGDLDLLVPSGENFLRDGQFWSHNHLFRNDGAGAADPEAWELVTASTPILGRHGFSAAWGDYDNDADLDVFIGGVNGRSKLFRNDGDADGNGVVAFADATGIAGLTPPAGEHRDVAVTWADFDRDGDLDLLVARQEVGPVHYRNRGLPAHSWVEVIPVNAGGPFTPIGTRVEVTAMIGGRLVTQTREISGGEGAGSQGPPVAHVGLGPGVTRVERIQIRWPDGPPAEAITVLDGEDPRLRLTVRNPALPNQPSGGMGAIVVVDRANPAPPPVTFIRGDANRDGDVNLSDAVFSLNGLFLGGRQPTCQDAADTNDDGQWNLSDAIGVLNYLFLSGCAPRTPGPETKDEIRDETGERVVCPATEAGPGEDPTPDELPECAPPE